MVQTKEKYNWVILNISCFYSAEIQIFQTALVWNVNLPTQSWYLYFSLFCQPPRYLQLLNLMPLLVLCQGLSARRTTIITWIGCHVTVCQERDLYQGSHRQRSFIRVPSWSYVMKKMSPQHHCSNHMHLIIAD